MASPFWNTLAQSLRKAGLIKTKRSSRQRHRQRTLSYESLETRELLAVVSLQDFSVSTNTGEKPQSKMWEHAGQWWSVMPNSGGTWVWRLDGTSWTPALQLTTNSGSHADVKAAGEQAHILLFGGQQSQLATIEYVNGSTPGYQLWSLRPELVGVQLSSGVETATLDIDSTGRMWIASDASNTVEVRYSDGLYTNWSEPITVASGINSDDISVITAMPDNQIGVFWSNQSTDRFGFRLHQDGSAPTLWLADEVPASQSALNVGGGMADDHMNVAVASDGTLYAAVKTSYDSSGRPAIALLVRRPTGVWEDLYEVDTGGTRPIVVLNEVVRKLFVAYTTNEGGGNIVYRESSMDTIAFEPRQTFIYGNVNNVTSTKQNFKNEVVVMASSSGNAKSVLFSFDSLDPNQSPTVGAGVDQTVELGTAAVLDGTVSDDGLPAPGALTTWWSKVSGPGTVTFGDSGAVDTTAQFSVAGTYVLQLWAGDGSLSAFDEMTVVVDPIQPNENDPVEIAFQDGLFPSLTYAGTRDTRIYSGSGNTNYGNATVITIDGSPDNAALLKWDISTIASNSVVVSAAIELNVTNRSVDNYEVYALERAWDELSATWQQYAAGAAWGTAGANGAGDHGSEALGTIAPASTGLYRIALNDAGVAAVQSWISDPALNFGVILKDYAESDGIDFSASESSIASLRPKLILNYRPATQKSLAY